MGNLSKRFLSILIAAVMVFSMLPASVFATTYDITDMSDAEVAALAVQLEAEGNYDALQDIYNQLVEAGRVEDGEVAMPNDYDVSTIADSTATVTAYKQVDYVTEKVVDAKYFEYLGTAATVEAAAAMIGSNGLIEISAGTLVVTNRQDITEEKSNIIIKGAGKDVTTIVGNASNFNGTTNGLGSSNLSTEYKAILGLHGENIKVMDLTIDAGDCGVATGGKIPFTNIFVQTGWADIKTVRINSGVSYLQNVNINGTKTRANLMVGTSTTTSVVHANGLNVAERSGYSSTATEISKGSTLNTINSMLGGAVVGSVESLGEGYYKIEYAGAVVYTTIPYAIECYENGTFSSDLFNSNMVGSTTPVVAEMTADLTTITSTGSAKLLYGYNCAEMRQLAVDFAEALKGLSADTNVDATKYLLQLSAALQIENWHNVDDNGTCAHCGATGLETPAPEVEVEIPSVEEIVPDNATEEEKEVISDVIEDLKQNEAVKDFVPENLAEGSNLSITLTGVEVKGEQTKVPEKITYDVKPVDKDNNVTAPTGKVTFRLPIPASVTKPLASVYHNGTLMGTYKIQTTNNGKYVEVTTDSFSTFTVEMEEAPKATVTPKDPVLLSPVEHDYMCWPDGDDTIDRPLQIVLNFKAEDTLEECLAGKFSKYLVDFYLTLDGLTNGAIVSDGCYLAGNYGSFGWIVIPADELELEERISYPVVSGYDATLNYKDICKSVQDFTAAIYITPALLEANPNMTVTLELRMTNPNDETNVLVVGEPMTYTAAQLLAGLEFLGGYADARDEQIGNIDNVNEDTTIDSDAHESVIEQMKNDLSGIYTSEQLEAATTDVIIAFKEMKHETNGAPVSVTYSVSPVLKVNNVDYKITEFTAPVTFRLPVYSAESSTQAKVYHEGELMGVYAIQTEGNLKYVEVSSMNFSDFTVEPITTDASYVAQVGGKLYTSLQDAIDAANGQTVILLENIELTEGLVISKGVTVTLDLNGKVVSQEKAQTGAYSMITNYGNLTIQDTIGGGKISYKDTTVYTSVKNHVSNTISNYGTLTVLSGVIENNSDVNVGYWGYPYTIDNNSSAANAVLNIVGGTLNNTAYCSIRQYCNSTTYENVLNISGGTLNAGIEFQNPNTLANKGTLNITGGTINGGDNVAALYAFGANNSSWSNMSASISGGSFTGNITVKESAKLTGFITGGTFSTDVSAFMADGYKLDDNGNGTYGVQVDPAYGKVAKVGDTYYATLQDAINAAGKGDTVLLLTDVTISQTIKIEKAIKLDLNGNEVTANTRKAFEVFANATFQNGSIVADSRCIDTRTAVELTLTNLNLTAVKSGTSDVNNQPLTIGGNTNGTKVTMTNVNITTSQIGYGIITWVTTELVATDCTIYGYMPLHVRDGEGSEFIFNNCVLTSDNTGNDVVGNSTSVLGIYDHNTKIEVNGGKLIAKGNNSHAILISNRYVDTTGANIFVNAEIVGKVLRTSQIENNTITLPAAYADALGTDGFGYTTNDDGTITAVKAEPDVSVSFKEVTLLLKNEVKLKFYLYVNGITGDTIPNAGIEVWNADIYNADNLPAPSAVYTGFVKNGSLYQIYTNGISAKNMGDLIYVRAYVEVDGVRVYTNTISTSPAVFCQWKINQAAQDPTNVEKMDEAKLCIALMNYGAEAQKYFAENTDYTYTTLMNSFISDKQQGWIDASYSDSIDTKPVTECEWDPADTSVIKLDELSVLLTGALQMKLKVKVGVTGTVKLYYWTEAAAANGLTIANAAEMANVSNSGKYYQGYVLGIAAKNMGDTVYMCAAVEVDGVTHYTKVLALSVHAYADYMISVEAPEAALSKALVIYSNVAKEYMAKYNTQE